MLIICPECASEISSEAKKCPRCGLPDAGKRGSQMTEGQIKVAKARWALEKALRKRNGL